MVLERFCFFVTVIGCSHANVQVALLLVVPVLCDFIFQNDPVYRPVEDLVASGTSRCSIYSTGSVTQSPLYSGDQVFVYDNSLNMDPDSVSHTSHLDQQSHPASSTYSDTSKNGRGTYDSRGRYRPQGTCNEIVACSSSRSSFSH